MMGKLTTCLGPSILSCFGGTASVLPWLSSYLILTMIQHSITGIILCMSPTNERQHYNVTPSPTGWSHTLPHTCPWVPGDLRERTKTMRSHGGHRGQIGDFWDSFEIIKLLYLHSKCEIKTKTHFEWLLWHWSSFGLMGCKVPTDLVKISVKEATHMGFY